MDFCYIKSVTLKLLKGMAGRKSRRVKRRRRNNITIKRVQRGGGRGRRRSRRGRNQIGGGAAMPLLILGSMLAPVIEKSLGGLINKI